MAETPEQYADRQRAADLDLVGRARRAQEAINALGAGPVARNVTPFVPQAITDSLIHRFEDAGTGYFARMGEELLAKEDSERVTPTRAESDLDWELR